MNERITFLRKHRTGLAVVATPQLCVHNELLCYHLGTYVVCRILIQRLLPYNRAIL